MQFNNPCNNNLSYKQTVLLVTFGRTGSTLLMGVLNSSPRVLLRGENANFCYGLFNVYQNRYSAWRKHSGPHCMHPVNPWFGSYFPNDDSVLLKMRTMFLSMLYPWGGEYDCIGFKEIRYLPLHIVNKHENYLQEYLDFLKILFCNTKFVFYTRDHQDVCASKWWKNTDPTVNKQYFTSFETCSNEYFISNQESCYSLTYNDVTSNNATLKGLFDFLNIEYSHETVNEVLKIKHSY